MEDGGYGSADTIAGLARLGFFACRPDLEGELIRALGVDRMQELLAEHGELARFRRFQHQPVQRERPTDAQLRRFLGTHSGRKAQFAPLMVDALEESRIPAAMRELVGTAVDRESASLLDDDRRVGHLDAAGVSLAAGRRPSGRSPR
ncbi:hypothetical protein ASE14_11305 [Agromyces sp. Root81]|uniref:hypothetical protein n=1 Tax=Agromyces sp. Root81 TaxID=1736601 RepID=UPI0006FD836A|nr:hypothetical protein [Agromyces sp. Root81]KRC61449.1 hypothetical protein ASE14_11305 [Agromyces sp. Root81]